MGLDFSYVLYFKKNQLWDALQGVVAIADPHHPPTQIHFPDHVLPVPLCSWLLEEKEVHHDDPEFSFAISLLFEEDEVIQDYILRHNLGYKDSHRSPPDKEGENRIAIGFIYLTIYKDLSQQYFYKKPPEDLVLFDFGTTGTRMSLLFDYSTSIRKTFVGLLTRCKGVCGVFNREDGGGELFWLEGQENLSLNIGDAYKMPHEIKEILRRGW